MSRFLIFFLALLAFVPIARAEPRADALPAGAVARLGKVRYRNVGRVFSIAFSPDGKTLLAAAWDGSIRLWDVAAGKELRQYVGHSGWARSVAFSPDGKTFASGGKDKIIRLWETATGKELRRFEGHQNWVQHLAFSPDGKTLASWGTGQTLRLWDVGTGREQRRIDLPQWASASLAFSPDGKLFAHLGEARSIALRDVATGKDVHRLPNPRFRDWFGDFVFSPDGKMLAGVDYAVHTLHLWDTTTGKELRPLGERGGDIYTVVFAPDGRSIASVGGSHSIRVWEAITRQERCDFPCPDKRPLALAFAPDGRTLAQGSDDTTVLLWDLTGRQEKGRLNPASLSAKELQERWADLASADAAAAHRAIWALAAAPRQSLPFIREHLWPAAPVDAHTLARLVADLDSDRFETRRQATEKLEKQRELVEPTLRRALRDKPPLETRRRIDRLLEKVASERENPPAERLRMLRALETLEHMDDSTARRTLEELAKGAAESDLTKESAAALERLAKRP